MAVEFLMPKLGLTMEEGRIVEWLVADGAHVARGAPVLRIETDKTESDVEAADDGVLHITGAVGETYACGQVVGWLLAEGEAPPEQRTADPHGEWSLTQRGTVATAGQPHESSVTIPGAAAGRPFASPNARRVAAELGVDLGQVRGTGPGGRIVSEDVEAAAARIVTDASPGRGPGPVTREEVAVTGDEAAGTRGVVTVTPAARQLAELVGADLAAVAPLPGESSVSRAAVARHVREQLAAPALAPATPPQPPPAPVAPPAAAATSTLAAMPLLQEPTEVRKLSGARGTIAKRMHASLHEMAQLTLMMDADMDAVVADRTARKAAGAAPSFTDYIVAAAARALREHPIVNAQVTERGIALLPDIHVGVAVAVPAGLLVPVVRHADTLTLTALAAETTRLAELGRAGKLKLPDLEGGTFSVSALGMFGVDGFTPVINPPNVAILGVGRLRDEVVLVDGAVRTTTRLTLSLTWDHRVLDGAPAAQFTQTIVRLLADPARLDEV